MAILIALTNSNSLPYANCVAAERSSKQSDYDENATWAKAYRARRAFLGKTQEQIVADSGDTLTQSDVSRLSRGKLHPADGLSITKFFGMLRAFEWTIDEWSEATMLEVPYLSQEQASALEAAAHLEVKPKYIEFPVFGTASAGEQDAEPLETEVAFIPESKLRAKGVDANSVVVYVINGDCMISAEARRVEKNIVHGDYVAVDTRRRPQPGDTVAAWWPADRKLVIKRYRVEREGIILYPASPGHPTLVLPHEDDVNILGVVFWREG